MDSESNKPLRLARERRSGCEVRKKRVQLFLDELEEAKWKQDADLRRLNRHDYLRALIMEQTTNVVHRGYQADPHLIEELNRIGNNLNQAVLYVHAGTSRETDWEALRKLLEETLLHVMFGPEVEEEDDVY